MMAATAALSFPSPVGKMWSKSAAETAARNLLDRKPAGPRHGRVHQPGALVVGDQPDRLTLFPEVLRQLHEREDLTSPRHFATKPAWERCGWN